MRLLEGQRNVSAADLLALDDDHLLQRLKSEESSGLNTAWDAAVSQDPLRALRLLGRLLADDGMPSRVLWEVVWQATPPAADRDFAMRALDVIAELPAGSIEQRPEVASALAAFVAKTAEQDWYEGFTDARLLAIWDRLIGPVVTTTEQVGLDRGPDLSTILPIDELVLFLLHGLDRTRAGEAAEQRASFRARLDRLTTDTTHFGAALRQLGRWLPFLNAVEPRWTETHLVRAFAWHVNLTQAPIAWRAYLAGAASMPAALWPKMRLPFVGSFKAGRLSDLGPEPRGRLAQLLVRAILFQSARPLSDHAARRLFRACAPAYAPFGGLVSVADIEGRGSA